MFTENLQDASAIIQRRTAIGSSEPVDQHRCPRPPQQKTVPREAKGAGIGRSGSESFGCMSGD